MGTRADFYLQAGDDLLEATYQGSIAWDGYPDNPALYGAWQAKTVEAFGEAIEDLRKRGDWSCPEKHGWPWPWEDSRTTDYAYVFVEPLGEVHVFGFGMREEPLTREQVEALSDADRDRREEVQGGKVAFPDMTGIQKVTMGRRSGLIVFGG